MNWITITPIILTLSATAFTTQVNAADTSGQWKAYVCRVTEWPDCEQGRNNKRIYPDQTLYPDMATCLDGFGQLFKHDPVISVKYPQTNDAGSSYVFDCEQAQ